MRLAFALLILITQATVHAGTLTGRVVRVTDGDTIVVLGLNNAQHKIRLMGIDAPERGQAFSGRSKENLSDHVAGRFVVVEYEKRDRYQRIVGKVLLGGQDMNLGQIAAGLAWHYKKYQGEQTPTDRIRYSEAEFEARKANRGLWHDPTPNPPWEYRQAKREQMKALKPFTNKSESKGKPY